MGSSACMYVMIGREYEDTNTTDVRQSVYAACFKLDNLSETHDATNLRTFKFPW
jgi:hypothetical protein